jgi:hypothetical protein
VASDTLPLLFLLETVRIHSNLLLTHTLGKVNTHYRLKANPIHGEVYSKQHYVIKFFSDLRQVGGFLRIIQFPPRINLTATI